MGNVGGDPARMTGGAKDLHASGIALQQMGPPLRSQGSAVAGAVGDATLSTAVSRFGAAWAAVVDDTGTQTVVAGQLAANAATDLTRATGGH
jgi:hypothetical protein